MRTNRTRADLHDPGLSIHKYSVGELSCTGRSAQKRRRARNSMPLSCIHEIQRQTARLRRAVSRRQASKTAPFALVASSRSTMSSKRIGIALKAVERCWKWGYAPQSGAYPHFQHTHYHTNCGKLQVLSFKFKKKKRCLNRSWSQKCVSIRTGLLDDSCITVGRLLHNFCFLSSERLCTTLARCFHIYCMTFAQLLYDFCITIGRLLHNCWPTFA